ncbi:hypothetical protein J6R97_00225 [bacterium]|nr:hypothetical protein [bacterium]
MLVSMFSMYNAINMRNRAIMGMIGTNNSTLSFLGNTRAEQCNLESLHELDTINSLNLARYQLMYLIANATEKQAKASLKEETQDKNLNILA